MLFNTKSSKLAVAVTLTSSLLLTACGGSSDSNDSKAAGAGVDYEGKTTAATDIPATAEGKQALADAIAQVLSVQTMPLYRSVEFAEDVVEREQSCTQGSTEYKAKIETEYDKEWDETFEYIVSANVSFDKCVVNKKTYNGSLTFKADETKTSATDKYQFKQLSVKQDNLYTNNQYQFDGEFIKKFTLNKSGDIDVNQSWNFSIIYTDPNQETAFKTKGTLTYVTDFEDDELNSLAAYKASFSLNEKDYQLEYKTDDVYGYDPDLMQVKFYDSELGFYSLDVSDLGGKTCSKNSKFYSGLEGEILLKDASGANLLSVTINCDKVTYQ